VPPMLKQPGAGERVSASAALRCSHNPEGGRLEGLATIKFACAHSCLR